MKKLLLLSDPPVAPGYLPRVRYLCDFLVQQGFGVTFLTEQAQKLDFEHTYPIETLKMYSGGRFDWFIKTVWTLLTDWHNRVFADKWLLSYNQSSNRQSIDAVIVSAFSDFPLGAALRIAKHLQVPLICDIRDLDEQIPDSRYQYRHQIRWLMPFRKLYRAIHIHRRNKVLCAADAVTTISPWHADFIRNIRTSNSASGLTSDSAAVHIIYNGFDHRQFHPEDIKTEQFTVTYIGSLFDWQKQALAKVQKVLDEINSQSSIVQSSVSLDLHTPQHHPVPHNALGDAIRQSSIMLVLTKTRTHGMLTTKFYEALGCAKPILCVPSDKGELARLIARTNAGIATDDEEQIKTFVLNQYREWQTQGFTHQPVVRREDYSRENQCKQFINILNTILQ